MHRSDIQPLYGVGGWLGGGGRGNLGPVFRTGLSLVNRLTLIFEPGRIKSIFRKGLSAKFAKLILKS